MMNRKSPIAGLGISVLLTITACSNSSESTNTGEALLDASGETSMSGSNTESESEPEGNGSLVTNSELNADDDSMGSESGMETDTNPGQNEQAETEEQNSQIDNGVANGSSDFLKFGFVGVDKSEYGIFIDAFFSDINQPVPDAVNDVFDGLENDRCELESNDGTVLYTDFPELDVDEDLIRSISAGEVLTLSTPAGSFAELLRDTTDETNIFYQPLNGESLGAEIPAQLVINIPGDEFPAFSNVPISDVASLIITSPEPGNGLAADSVIRWVASENPNTSINLSLSYDGHYLFCDLVDDGEFEIPEYVMSSLPAAGQYSLFLDRESLIYYRNGNAVLGVSTYAATE